MKSIQALLSQYFGLVLLFNFALSGASIALRKRESAAYFWLPAIVLNTLFGIYSIGVALPGFSARGPDAVGVIFLFIPLGLGTLSIAVGVATCYFRPEFSPLRITASALFLVSAVFFLPKIDRGLERTAIIQILDDTGKPMSVQADAFFSGTGDVSIKDGMIIVRFSYRAGYLPIVVHRADGKMADIGLSYVGLRSGGNGYFLSESEVVEGTTVPEEAIMKFSIQPEKWKNERSPTSRYRQ